MAIRFGKVRRWNNRGRERWVIDLGRRVSPRILYSARGAKFDSRDVADAVLGAIRAKIAKGVPPQTAVDEFAPVSVERNSVHAWSERYLERLRERCDAEDLAPGTLREVLRYASSDGHWSWWAGRTLHEVDAPALEDFAAHLRTKGLGPKSVKNVLGAFRAFLGYLRRLEVIERIPVFPVVRVPDHQPTIISPRTQRLVLDEIPHDLRGIFLACAHGVRPGEARALDVTHVQEREGVPGLMVGQAMKGPNANARRGGTKTGDASWIPIDDELAAWIAWRLDQTEGPWRPRTLFVNTRALAGPNPERRWTANTLRKVWNAAAAQVGVRVQMYEGTKHSSATAWRTHGMPLDVIRRMLRHRDARSTERYSKLADGALVEAFRRTPRARRGDSG